MRRSVMGLFVIVFFCSTGAMAQTTDDFLQGLENTRNPFLTYLEKPAVPVPELPVSVPSVVSPESFNRVSTVVLPEFPPAIPVVNTQPEPVRDDSFLRDLILNGIVWNTQMPQAIINGTVVKVGDEIAGAQIQSINKKGVGIRKNGFDFLISINDNKIDDNDHLFSGGLNE